VYTAVVRIFVLLCIVISALVLVTSAGAKHGRQARPHLRQLTVGWDNGARWGTPIELDEETYSPDYIGDALPQVIVRIVQDGQNRTVTLEFYDDINGEWVTDDVQRTVGGTALLTPDPWCEDNDGNEAWCDGVWRYRIRSMPEGAMPGSVSRTTRITLTAYNPCYAWDQWSCGDSGWG